MLKNIKHCFENEKVLYTKHAKDEMENEEFGEIQDEEVFQAILSGKIIETYPDDEPYPSCLIYGRTLKDRPVHVVCSYSDEDDLAIVITVYQPDPQLWVSFERRKV